MINNLASNCKSTYNCGTVGNLFDTSSKAIHCQYASLFCLEKWRDCPVTICWFLCTILPLLLLLDYISWSIHFLEVFYDSVSMILWFGIIFFIEACMMLFWTANENSGDNTLKIKLLQNILLLCCFQWGSWEFTSSWKETELGQLTQMDQGISHTM